MAARRTGGCTHGKDVKEAKRSFSDLPSASVVLSSLLHREINALRTLCITHEFPLFMGHVHAHKDGVQLSLPTVHRTWQDSVSVRLLTSSNEISGAEPFQPDCPHLSSGCLAQLGSGHRAYRQSSSTRQIFRRAAGTPQFPGTFPAASSDPVSLCAQLKLVKIGRENLATNPGGLCVSSKQGPNTDFQVALNFVSSELTDVGVLRLG